MVPSAKLPRVLHRRPTRLVFSYFRLSFSNLLIPSFSLLFRLRLLRHSKP